MLANHEHTENDLWRRIANGDIAGFRSFMKLYFPVLCTFSENFVKDPAQAKDIAQETFIKVWDRHASFESLGSLKKFMYVTARNSSLNVMRDRQRAAERGFRFLEIKEEAERFALDEVIYAELLAGVRQAIDTLPLKMKEIFVLSFIEGLSNQEIADRLELSQQTVRNQKTRALQLLKAQFDGKDYPLMLLLALYTAGHTGF